VISARPYQTAARQAIRDAIGRGVRRMIIALATGLGKTVVAAHEIAETRDRVLFVAHRDELLRQTDAKIRMVDPDAEVGFVKAEEDDVSARIVIGSVQTLCQPKRLQRFKDSLRGDLWRDPERLGVVFVDEAHHANADSYQSVLRGLGCFDDGGPITIGLTATPERSDGKALADVWEEIVYEYGILDGIRDGYLCEPRAKQIKLKADFRKLQVRAGEFRDEQSAEMLMEADAPKHAAEAYLQHAKGLRALAFTPTVSVAKAFEEAFCAAGVPTEFAHGEMPLEQRRAIVGRLERGETFVVPNAQLFTEGTDIPSVACIIVAKPTRSRPAYVQMVGRGTRLYPGKSSFLILDLVGVAHRHDLTTMATLFDVDPDDAEEGLSAALEKKAGSAKAGSAAKASDENVEGQLVSVDVELFKSRDFAWIESERTAGKFVLSLGLDGTVVLESTGPDRFDVFKVKRETPAGRRWPVEVRTKLYTDLSLGYAQGIAEDLVRKSGAAVLNARDAGWRKGDPSEKQRALLQRRGRWRDGMTRGEASDVLTALLAR
jgi:superfamily II DNA or RNA helicase